MTSRTGVVATVLLAVLVASASECVLAVSARSPRVSHPR